MPEAPPVAMLPHYLYRKIKNWCSGNTHGIAHAPAPLGGWAGVRGAAYYSKRFSIRAKKEMEVERVFT
jgi:hypothetical protein